MFWPAERCSNLVGIVVPSKCNLSNTTGLHVADASVRKQQQSNRYSYVREKRIMNTIRCRIHSTVRSESEGGTSLVGNTAIKLQ